MHKLNNKTKAWLYAILSGNGSLLFYSSQVRTELTHNWLNDSNTDFSYNEALSRVISDTNHKQCHSKWRDAEQRYQRIKSTPWSMEWISGFWSTRRVWIRILWSIPSITVTHVLHPAPRSNTQRLEANHDSCSNHIVPYHDTMPGRCVMVTMTHLPGIVWYGHPVSPMPFPAADHFHISILSALYLQRRDFFFPRCNTHSTNCSVSTDHYVIHWWPSTDHVGLQWAYCTGRWSWCCYCANPVDVTQCWVGRVDWWRPPRGT